MPSARFFKDGDRDMVEITNEADRNTVILPADDVQQARYPQEWAKHANLGARIPHEASPADDDGEKPNKGKRK